MNENIITIMEDEFEKGNGGERVKGVTVIIDGKLKQVMDIIIAKYPDYENYVSVVRDALIEGINVITSKNKK